MGFAPGSPEYLSLAAEVPSGLGAGHLAVATLMSQALLNESTIFAGNDGTATIVANVDKRLVLGSCQGVITAQPDDAPVGSSLGSATRSGVLYSLDKTMLTADSSVIANTGLAVGFAYDPSVSPDVVLDPAKAARLPVLDPVKVAAGNAFLRAKTRSSSTGIRVIDPRVDSSGHVIAGVDALVNVAINEQQIVSPVANQTFEYAQAIEWEALPRTGPVQFEYFANIISLTDNTTNFIGEVAAGDIVRVDSRSTYPITVDTRLAGATYYRVVDLTAFSLQLTPLSKVSDGVYVAGTQFTTWVSSNEVDYRIIRTDTDKLVVRTGIDLSGVKALDWVHIAYSATSGNSPQIYTVANILPGLIVLNNQPYKESAPPLSTDGSAYTVPFIDNVGISITRVPSTPSAFTLHDPIGDFASARPGDFVTLTARTGGLDATALPGVICHTFQVAVVVDRYTLSLDSAIYDQVGSVYVTASSLYQILSDHVGYSMSFYSTVFPYAGLYKVVDYAPGGIIHLEPSIYGPDSAFDGDIGVETTLSGSYQDVFDLEVVYMWGDQLLLNDPTGDFTALQPYDATVNHFDLVHVSFGSLLVESVPRKDVVFLNRSPRRLFPPYIASPPDYLQQQATGQPMSYYLTRATQRFKSLVIAGSFPGALANQFVELSPNSATMTGLDKFMLRISAVAATQITLDGDQFYGIDAIGAGTPFDWSVIGAGTGPVSFEIWAPPVGVNSVTIKYPPFQVSDLASGPSVFEQVMKLTPPATSPLTGTDIIYFTYKKPDQTYSVLQLIPIGVNADGSLSLSPFPAIGVSGSGRYTMGTSPIVPYPGFSGVLFSATGNFAVRRPAFGRDVAVSTVAALHEILGSTVDEQAIYNTLFPADMTTVTGIRLLSIVRGAVAAIGLQSSKPISFLLPDTTLPWKATTKTLTPLQMGNLLLGPDMDSAASGPWQAIADTTAFQQAIAFIVQANFSADLAPKTLHDLKDSYIDARLKYEGYGDYILSLGTGGGVGRDREVGSSIGSQLIAKKVMDESLAIIVSRRPDLKSSLDGQYRSLIGVVMAAMPVGYTSLLGVVMAAMPVGYIFPMRFFVQSGIVSVSQAIEGSLPLFSIPFLGEALASFSPFAKIYGAVSDPNPIPRRQTITGMIGVPADRSLLANQRSYIVSSNNSSILDATAQDLQRHSDTATNPGIKAQLKAWLDELTKKKIVADALTNKLSADITAQGGDAFSSDTTAPPGDAMAVSRMAPPIIGSAYNSSGIPKAMTLMPTALSSPVVTPASAKAVNAKPAKADTTLDGAITNLFKEDFQDFRRTGLVQALNIYDQDEDAFSNKSRLASIYLTDALGAKKGKVVISPTATTDANSTNWKSGTFNASEYNQFILSGMQEMHSEKNMIMDTLGNGWIGLMFGSAPEVWTVSGILINDTFNDQLTKFRDLWDQQIRGTQLAKNRVKMALDIPAAGVTIIGYPISIQMNIDAGNNEVVVPFSMQIVVSLLKPRPMLTLVNTASKKIPMALNAGSGSAFGSSLGIAATSAAKQAVDALVSATDGTLIGPIQPAAQAVSNLGTTNINAVIDPNSAALTQALAIPTAAKGTLGPAPILKDVIGASPSVITGFKSSADLYLDSNFSSSLNKSLL